MEIKDKILDDVRSARWFSVMADECTDVSTLEQMSMCFRFVDEIRRHQPEIREEFVGFVKLQKTDADTIYKEIMEFIRDCNLDVTNLRGQGYDGASVMAGNVTGVATQILRQQPKAMYCHCRAHNLNLIVSSTCKQVPEIRNLFDTLRTLTWFLGASAKRKEILKKYLMSDDISRLFVGENADLPEEEQEEADKMVIGSAKQQVPKMCETRMSACLATVSSVIAKYKAIHLTLNDISIESSQTEVRNNALSYYRLMQSSTFIVSLVVAQFVLSFSHPLCLSLQKVSCDVKAYRNAKLCKETISKQGSVTKFKEVWEKAKKNCF